MHADIDHVLRGAAAEPQEPVDVADLTARHRRRRAVRGVAGAGVAAVLLVVVVAALPPLPGPDVGFEGAASPGQAPTPVSAPARLAAGSGWDLTVDRDPDLRVTLSEGRLRSVGLGGSVSGPLGRPVLDDVTILGLSHQPVTFVAGVVSDDTASVEVEDETGATPASLFAVDGDLVFVAVMEDGANLGDLVARDAAGEIIDRRTLPLPPGVTAEP